MMQCKTYRPACGMPATSEKTLLHTSPGMRSESKEFLRISVHLSSDFVFAGFNCDLWQGWVFAKIHTFVTCDWWTQRNGTVPYCKMSLPHTILCQSTATNFSFYYIKEIQTSWHVVHLRHWPVYSMSLSRFDHLIFFSGRYMPPTAVLHSNMQQIWQVDSMLKPDPWYPRALETCQRATLWILHGSQV